MTNVATLAIIINLILWLRVHLTNSRGKVFSLALSITGITLLASPLLVNLKFIVFYILLVSIIPSIFKPTGTALVLSAKNTSTTTATQRLSLIDHKAQANGLQSQLEAAAQTLTQLKNEQTKMWSQMSQMDHQLIAQQRAKIKKIYDVVQQLSTENTHQVDMYHQDKRLSNVDDTRLHQQLTQQKEKLKRMRIDADQLFREIKQKKKVITLAQFSKNNQASILPLPKGFLNKKFTFCTSLVNRLHQDLIAGSKKRTHLQNKYQQTWNQGKVFYASKVAQQKSDIQQFNSEMHQLHLQYHRAKNVVKQLKKDNPDHAYAFNIIDQSIDKELQELAKIQNTLSDLLIDIGRKTKLLPQNTPTSSSPSGKAKVIFSKSQMEENGTKLWASFQHTEEATFWQAYEKLIRQAQQSEIAYYPKAV